MRNSRGTLDFLGIIVAFAFGFSASTVFFYVLNDAIFGVLSLVGTFAYILTYLFFRGFFGEKFQPKPYQQVGAPKPVVGTRGKWMKITGSKEASPQLSGMRLPRMRRKTKTVHNSSTRLLIPSVNQEYSNNHR